LRERANRRKFRESFSESLKAWRRGLLARGRACGGEECKEGPQRAAGGKLRRWGGGFIGDSESGVVGGGGGGGS